VAIINQSLFAIGPAVSSVILAMLLVLSSHTGCAEEPAISVHHNHGISHPVQEGLERFRKDLAGVVSVHVKTPKNERESAQGLIAGTVDAAVVSPLSLQAMVRELAMLDLIGLWRDRVHWGRALDGIAGRELARIVERGTEGGDKGLQVLGFWGGTRRHLLTRREGVGKMEDLNGLRLGIAINPVRSKMWKTLGVQPILPIHTDMLADLRDGSVEGVEEEAGAILQAQLYKAASHLTETGHTITTRLFLISKSAWGRLTPAQRAAITTAARTAAIAARTSEESRETDTLTTLKERYRVTLHRFTAYEELRTRTRTFRSRYAGELNAATLLALMENTPKP